MENLKIDFWFNNSVKDIAGADCFFYPNGGYYAGNVYDRNGKAIGDYTETDSTKIEKAFPGIFGE